MSILKAFTHIDMLKGSLWDRLFLFAVPLALTNVLQQLFNTADVAILGHYVGATAMAAVGSLSPVISLIVAVFLGLALGANVVVAQKVGCRNWQGLKSAARSALFFALGLGLGLLAICYPLLPLILKLLGVPADIAHASADYFAAYLLGLPALALYNFAAALLRSLGDTATPFVSLALASLLNLVLNLLAVLVLDLGVVGVALATTLANYVSALILLWRCFALAEFGLRQALWPLDFGELKSMLQIGLPAAVQGMVFCFSNVIVQSAINSLGPIIIAASAAAFTLEINLYCLMSAFAQATTTFVSQNYGARNLARSIRVTRVTLFLTIPINLFMSVLIILSGPSLLSFFTTDPLVVESAMQRLYFIVLPNVVTIFIDVLSGALRGYGCSLPPALATLVAICGIRIVWVFTVFRLEPSFAVLMLSYPLSWLATAFFITLVYLRFRKVVLLHGHRLQK
ncbi:MAG: MATE family efflux transporter [Desulfovibrio sp.]|nr:MATE family efflux transporter [Desulfovibrio sp.]